MGIKIQEISVKNLGPIKDFQAKFGLLNLIYSKNERGKTFLTEFIIRSLFRNTSRWTDLRSGGNGKVTVSGIRGGTAEFLPHSPEKLEDFWENNEKGLPASVARLLVVKGGEAAIDDTRGGVDKYLIKEVLSGMNILDRIDHDDNISKTVKGAEIENSHLSISRRGEGKQYNSTKEKLARIEELFEEIESQYTQGILKTYKMKEQTLIKEQEKLEKAKRHQAYLISRRISRLKEELNAIPEQQLNQLERDLSLYENRKQAFAKEREKLQTALKKSKDYKWLESALGNYKDLASKSSPAPNKFLLIYCGILAAITIVLIYFNLRAASIVFLIGALAPLFVYIKKYHKASSQSGQNAELKKIESEFAQRTGKKLTDIAMLEATLKMQQEFSTQASVIKEQLADIENELQDLSLSIKKVFLYLTGKQGMPEDGPKILHHLKKKHNSIKEQIDFENKRIYQLNVSEQDYLSDDAGIKYSRTREEEVQAELANIRGKIKIQEEDLARLKHRIYPITDDDPSISWEELIENLRIKRWEVQAELRELTAAIVGGIAVHKVITMMRKEEDLKIQQGLESETVLKPLRDLTQRYNRLTLKGDQLMVSDDYDNFDLRELSTGAREQVMLALRIGFASKLFQQDTLFLILDDAFQHSDWDRREILVNQLVDIQHRGWQIIYFTMDDHIKQLFGQAGKQMTEETYKSFEL